MPLKDDAVRDVIQAASQPELTHIILPGLPGDPDADYWTMYCGLTVRAFDDGTLDPHTDFYEGSHGHNATCPECLRLWEQRNG